MFQNMIQIIFESIPVQTIVSEVLRTWHFRPMGGGAVACSPPTTPEYATGSFTFPSDLLAKKGEKK